MQVSAIIEHITRWLNDYVEQSGTKGFGIDDDESALSGRQREVLAIFRRLNKANRHKMEPIPFCMIPHKLKTG